MLSRRTVAAVALLTLLGAWLRLDRLGEPALWLDELLNYDLATSALSRPWAAWLTGFEIENGPLYYALLLAGRASADLEFSMRIAAALVGIATIPLFGLLFAPRPLPAVVGAALLAASPLHVYYSREGRTYALLTLESVLVLLALLHPERRWARWAGFAGCVLAAFTAASAAPLLGAAFLAAVAGMLHNRSRAQDHLPTAAGAVAGALVLWVHYARFERPHGTSVLTPDLILRTANTFASTGLEWTHVQWTTWLFLFLAAAGALVAGRQRLPLIVMLVSVLGLAAGSLAWMGHWFSVRYVIVALPPYLALVAFGTAGLIERIPQARWRNAVAVAAVAILLVSGLPEARRESHWKVDWRAIVATLEERAAAGDRIITSNTWTAVCLMFYARQSGTPLDVRNANESVEAAKLLIGARDRAWLVVAGYHTDDRIREWMTSACPVWSSPIETAVVYAYPDCSIQ